MMMLMATDPGERQDCQPSPEATEAIVSARHARLSTEAALPAAEQLRDRVRDALAANHFAELLEATLRAAARDRLRRGLA